MVTLAGCGCRIDDVINCSDVDVVVGVGLVTFVSDIECGCGCRPGDVK